MLDTMLSEDYFKDFDSLSKKLKSMSFINESLTKQDWQDLLILYNQKMDYFLNSLEFLELYLSHRKNNSVKDNNTQKPTFTSPINLTPLKALENKKSPLDVNIVKIGFPNLNLFNQGEIRDRKMKLELDIARTVMNNYDKDTVAILDSRIAEPGMYVARGGESKKYIELLGSTFPFVEKKDLKSEAKNFIDIQSSLMGLLNMGKISEIYSALPSHYRSEVLSLLDSQAYSKSIAEGSLYRLYDFHHKNLIIFNLYFIINQSIGSKAPKTWLLIAPIEHPVDDVLHSREFQDLINIPIKINYTELKLIDPHEQFNQDDGRILDLKKRYENSSSRNEIFNYGRAVPKPIEIASFHEDNIPKFPFLSLEPKPPQIAENTASKFLIAPKQASFPQAEVNSSFLPILLTITASFLFIYMLFKNYHNQTSQHITDQNQHRHPRRRHRRRNHRGGDSENSSSTSSVASTSPAQAASTTPLMEQHVDGNKPLTVDELINSVD